MHRSVVECILPVLSHTNLRIAQTTEAPGDIDDKEDCDSADVEEPCPSSTEGVTRRHTLETLPAELQLMIFDIVRVDDIPRRKRTLFAASLVSRAWAAMTFAARYHTLSLFVQLQARSCTWPALTKAILL